MSSTLPPSKVSPIIKPSTAIKRKRNAANAVPDQPPPPRHYVFPATERNRQISLRAKSNNNELRPVTMAETTMVAAAAPVKRDTFASLESLPIGYRFVPTDEELVNHYLIRKIKNQELPMNMIRDVDIYENHPKKIVENQPEAKEGQWLFFSPRTRRYTNGNRPARSAGDGYWKATGPDIEIIDGKVKICDRKTLVYHQGSAPKGTKTNWSMHEYVLFDHQRQRLNQTTDTKAPFNNFVLCKIYKNKTRGQKEVVNDDHHQESNNSTTDHGENNVELISDSATNQDHHPANPNSIRVEKVEELRVIIPNQEPRWLQVMASNHQEPINPINFQPKTNVVHQPHHLNLDTRFSQLVAPWVQPPPSPILAPSVPPPHRPVTPQVPPPPRPVTPSVQPPPRPVSPSVQPPPRRVAPSVQPPPRRVAPLVQPLPPRPVTPSVQPPLRRVAASVQPPPRRVAPSAQPPPRSVAQQAPPPSRPFSPSVQPLPPRPFAPSDQPLPPRPAAPVPVPPPPIPVAQPVPPPSYHPCTCEPNYMMSCYNDTFSFNLPGPSYINQQLPQLVAAPPPYQTAVGGGCDYGSDEYIELSELLDFTEDDLINSPDFSMDFLE